MGYKINRVLTRVNEDYNDMQGPCEKGFHVPTKDEWTSVYNIWTDLGGGNSDGTNFGIAIKLPYSGYRSNYNSRSGQDTQGEYWTAIAYSTNQAACFNFYSSNIIQYNTDRKMSMAIRPFKDTPITPTNSWTKLYGTSIDSGGIFWDSTNGFISLSSNGTNWITIADKNLGATAVWNSGDTLSESNCGKYYQRGNNYGFPWEGVLSDYSSTTVDANSYGPGNYYSSSTFITTNPRDSSNNTNLRGGESQGSGTRLVEKQIYSSTPPVQPVNETFSYTGSDQTWTVPYTQEYIITAKGAGSNTSAGGLGQGTILLNAGDKLSIMVGQSGSSTSSTTYGFGGSSNYSSNRAGGGLSGVFTGDSSITASDSSRALVIGGGAGGGQSSSRYGGAGGGETGQTGGGSNYGTAGGGGTQTGRGSGGNAGSYQFNGGNGSGTYGRGGGGGRWGGNGSIGDGSGDDDKGAGGGSGYVKSTASDRTLTQGGGSAAGNNGQVTIVSVLQ